MLQTYHRHQQSKLRHSHNLAAPTTHKQTLSGHPCNITSHHHTQSQAHTQTSDPTHTFPSSPKAHPELTCFLPAVPFSHTHVVTLLFTLSDCTPSHSPTLLHARTPALSHTSKPPLQFSPHSCTPSMGARLHASNGARLHLNTPALEDNCSYAGLHLCNPALALNLLHTPTHTQPHTHMLETEAHTCFHQDPDSPPVPQVSRRPDTHPPDTGQITHPCVLTPLAPRYTRIVPESDMCAAICRDFTASQSLQVNQSAF